MGYLLSQSYQHQGGTESLLGDYEISGGGSGVHWDEIDEDISVEGLLLGIGDQTKSHHALET